MTSSEISAEDIERYEQAYLSDSRFLLATNAICHNSMLDVALKRAASIELKNQVFSNKIRYKELKVTDQKSTGRCWIFAALNSMRLRMNEELKLDGFEFSQPFVFFWDKFEKANFFLETMIELSQEDVDSRKISYLLKNPIQDGGQYDMFYNIVRKYGLVPLSKFPESQHSCNSKDMNWLITFKLRENAQKLRDMLNGGHSINEVRSEKDKMLEEIYRILCIFFGPPPKTFDWSYMTKDGEFKELTGLTPQSFYINHVTHQLENMVSLINDPRNPYGRLYTVDRLGNVVGGKEVQYINVPIDDLKKYAARTIASGDPVWFGCDVRKFFHAKSHSMDTKQFDFELVFGVEFNQSKADRLRYGQSLMTHAMMFTAFDGSIEDPKKWRVENSWGDKNNKGFAVMSNDWFENFMYQIVVDKNILSPEHADVFNQKPIVLPAWDPMGSLALLSSDA